MEDHSKLPLSRLRPKVTLSGLTGSFKCEMKAVKFAIHLLLIAQDSSKLEERMLTIREPIEQREGNIHFRCSPSVKVLPLNSLSMSSEVILAFV